MMNELLFFLSIIITFSGLLFTYKHFGKTGISCWICFASVMANIIVVKTVKCFGLTTTLGNVLFGSVFLATDILSEQYGKKEANRAVILGLMANIAYMLVSAVVLLYRPAITDFANDSINVLLRMSPRVCIGSICAYACGNFLDVAIFNRMKKTQGSKKLWLRNNVSTMVSQLLDNFVLHFIVFSSIMNLHEIVVLSFNVWVIEIIIAICDTPFIYYAKNKIQHQEQK